MLWDLFCRVIDNFGDMGVCWRLAVDLGQRGHQVRLWVDDPSALTWMAPQVQWARDHSLAMDVGRGQGGVTVHHWADAERPPEQAPALQAGEVVVEAFGCNPPDAFLARMPRDPAPQWVNLEYLSAEAYVERSHGLPSPVWSGPGAGLTKRFFYPGFTLATGGLLRETDLLSRHAAFDEAVRRTWLQSVGVPYQTGDRVVSVFCYANAPVSSLLHQLAQQACDTGQTIHVLLTQGHATQLGQAWQHEQGHLHLHPLPALPQPAFDLLLWSCDLNLVRGEDSAVRALWAARPHVWQIYEQDDGVHAEKLDAFMDRWMLDWPGELRGPVEAWWRAWNGLGPMPDTLPDWTPDTSPWARHSLRSRDTLSKQPDLAGQLIAFVAGPG